MTRPEVVKDVVDSVTAVGDGDLRHRNHFCEAIVGRKTRRKRAQANGGSARGGAAPRCLLQRAARDVRRRVRLRIRPRP